MGFWTGAVVVNTSSSHLLDDCAVKEALINGTIAGVALDGIEGPQWLEAWVQCNLQSCKLISSSCMRFHPNGMQPIDYASFGR